MVFLLAIFSFAFLLSFFLNYLFCAVSMNCLQFLLTPCFYLSFLLLLFSLLYSVFNDLFTHFLEKVSQKLLY